MRDARSVLAIFVVLAVPLEARAQFEQPPPATGDVPPETLEPAPPPPPPETPASPQPAPRVAPERRRVAVTEETTLGPERPVGFTVGIGLGYDLPSDLSLPNTTTVRFRLRSGLTFEPFLVLQVSGSSFDFEAGDDTSEHASHVGLGTNARIPVVGHGPIDFLIVAGARVDFTSADPDGADNDSSTVATSLLWGLGLEYWIGRQGALSITALNPLVSYSSTTEAQFDGDVTQSTWSAGAIFQPEVLLLAHLFL